MPIEIAIDGQVYGNWSSAKVFRSVETVSGKFDLETTATGAALFPIKVGQQCEIVIDDKPVLTGYVEALQVNYSGASHAISISGRDVTCDLIDSTIGPGIDIRGPISFENVLRRVLQQMGLRGISIINKAGPLESFSGSEIVSAEVDKKGFEFLESYARQRQVFLTTDGRGNIVITRAGQVEALGRINHFRATPELNNVLSASYEENQSDRFNVYTIYAQEKMSGASTIDFSATESAAPAQMPQISANDGEKNKKIATQKGRATDSAIRATRRLHLQNEESADSKIAQARAIWESNVRAGKAKKYSAALQGFYQDSAATRLWVPNERVFVADEYVNIGAEMIVWSVEYSYSLDGGSVSQLELVPPDALLKEPGQPKGKGRKKKKQAVGIDWTDE